MENTYFSGYLAYIITQTSQSCTLIEMRIYIDVQEHKKATVAFPLALWGFDFSSVCE